MKPTLDWHFTPAGRVIRWLGSLQLAIPTMIVVTLALCWGTYLESTVDAKTAKATVYGSWWFLGVMGVVCVNLIFAVITRYPWKRRHVGFMIVHASLVSLIAGGFWSLYGRVEGNLTLQQGMTAGEIDLPEEQLRLVEHQAGEFKTAGAIADPGSFRGRRMLGPAEVEIVDAWSNTREVYDILNDAPQPYRAVEIQFGPAEQSAMWIGDESRGEAPDVMGLRVRVLADGTTFTPPAPAPGQAAPAAAGSTEYAFKVGERSFPLRGVGDEAFDGWKITAIKRYAHAMVGGGGISDTGAEHNPAVEVTITDGRGTTERHVAFERFPDLVMSRAIEGSSKSGATLVPPSGGPVAGGGRPDMDTLVIHGDAKVVRMTYLGRDGTVTNITSDAPLPFDFRAGARSLKLRKQLTHAREQVRYEQAPSAEEHRPAIVLRVGGQQIVVPWKARVPFEFNGRVGLLQYGPRTYPLPFAVRLDEFRKTDYPGTEMAMAYESDVTVDVGPASGSIKTTISMNNPLARDGWKLYQSGFMGSQISVFSVMRDPGLPLTYIASTALCIGILITFYGRGLSWGHPGIPLPFGTKESAHVPPPADPGLDLSAPLDGNGPREPRAMDLGAGVGADPGRRAGDAARHVRT